MVLRLYGTIEWYLSHKDADNARTFRKIDVANKHIAGVFIAMLLVKLGVAVLALVCSILRFH